MKMARDGAKATHFTIRFWIPGAIFKPEFLAPFREKNWIDYKYFSHLLSTISKAQMQICRRKMTLSGLSQSSVTRQPFEISRLEYPYTLSLLSVDTSLLEIWDQRLIFCEVLLYSIYRFEYYSCLDIKLCSILILEFKRQTKETQEEVYSLHLEGH